MISEREKIFRTLTRQERRILAEYEDRHGCRLYGSVIYAVVRKKHSKTTKGGETAHRRK